MDKRCLTCQKFYNWDERRQKPQWECPSYRICKSDESEEFGLMHKPVVVPWRDNAWMLEQMTGKVWITE